MKWLQMKNFCALNAFVAIEGIRANADYATRLGFYGRNSVGHASQHGEKLRPQTYGGRASYKKGAWAWFGYYESPRCSNAFGGHCFER
jgi:hypothetical protein